MRTGIVVDNEFSNDIRVLREAIVLRGNDIDTHILCFDYGRRLTDHGFKVKRLNISRKLKNILFFFLNLIPVYEWYWTSRITKFIQSIKPDVLHVHDLYMSKAAYKAIQKSGYKITLVLDLHENYPYVITTYNWTKGFPRNILSRPGLWATKESEYLGYADHIVVLSENFRDILENRYPFLKGRFVVYPNVPDLNEWKDDGSIAGNPFKNDFPVMLYYGVVAERRGIFDCLEVCIDLARDNRDLNLLIIGPVDKKDHTRLDDYLQNPLIKEKVNHIPWINAAELPSYLRLADICIAPFHKNPHHESGIANKIFEYMLGEKPLIVSDCKPQKDLVAETRCGLVYENRQQLYDGIITLIHDGELSRQMGHNGRLAVLNKYNQEYFKHHLLNIYK